ncbi:MAG: membrane dipeptidase, partial [Rubricoccaceae bacterium]|nr:membrane dipeptidase [Rubricoccaceae bacterium]
MRLLALPLLLAACTDPAPGASPETTPDDDGLVVDTLVATDGGAVRMPEAVAARLVAEDPLWETALRLHYDALVMDGHVDTPSLMLDEGYRLGERHAPQPGRAHLDLPRMVEGGLDAP